jgi:predicted DNA-binding transcriptional regulator YafY
MAPLREAIVARRKVALAYTGAAGEPSQRTVHPLGLFFWGDRWSVAAWCELRGAFRSFRLDRIDRLRVLDQLFTAAPGQTLDDFVAQASTPRG